MSDIKNVDESHRLKPMPEDYDKALFNSLFKETKTLRKKLAFDIDARKFGIDHKELVSWFDVKFLYAFTKYHKDPKVKGFVINALQMLKHRLIMNSYLPKNELHQTQDITEMFNHGSLTDELTIDEGNNLLNLAKDYLKTVISDDAMFLLEIDLNPPPYILARLNNLKPEQNKIPKIPAELIADFLGIENEDASIYIKALRKEIEVGIEKAHNHFKSLNLY